MPHLRTISPTPQTLPVVMTIAGSDSSGGAGIEADLKTFTAHQVYGATLITGLTAQNTMGVSSISITLEETARDIMKQNLDDFLENGQLQAIKTGMLTQPTMKVLGEEIEQLKSKGVKLIVDPVMVSTSGTRLFDENNMKQCVETIVKYADLVTPNFEEASILYRLVYGRQPKEVENRDDLVLFGKELREGLECNVLLKGGHLPWDSISDKPFKGKGNKTILDVLITSEGSTVMESVAIESENNHGSGCTLSSSIAANVAKGNLILESVIIAIDYIHQGMSKMNQLGHGNGPLNHCVDPGIVSDILEEPKDAKDSEKPDQSILEQFKSHPDIKPSWEAYTKHKFLELVATNSLPFPRFLYFLKQDYHYLINYAQIHALAAAVAPDYRQTQAEALIIGEVGKEIERHKEKLNRKYGIDYDRDVNFDIGLKPGKACRDYCEYLIEVGRKNDYLLTKVALAPCLHGYYEAGIYAKSIRESHNGLNDLTVKQAEAYGEWIGDYTSQWYSAAHKNGKESLDILVEGNRDRWEEMVAIFAKVTKLEVAFWDEVLEGC